MTKLLLTLSFFTSAFAFSQYCTSGGPTSTVDSNVESISLVGTVGSISYTGCPGVLGVQVDVSQSVILDAGTPYLMSVQFGTCGGNYNGAGEAWIDYNQNNIFEPSESIGTWTGIPPTPMSTFNFTVPGGATTGATRMRVTHQEGGSLPLDPCASFSWGSVNDFQVTIQNGVDCSGYTGDDETTARVVNTYPFSESYSNALCYTNQNPVYNSPDVYYLLNSFSGLSSLDISLCGSGFDTFLTVLDEQGNPIAINDDSPNCGSQSEITVSTVGHNYLFVIVEGWNNQMGDYTLNISQGSLSTESLSEINFALFPNPATSTVAFSGTQSGTLTLIDSRGEVVLSQEVSPNEELNVSHLSTGLYVVKFQTESALTMQKLMIK